jgi:methylmalonyl-CoA mutase
MTIVSEPDTGGRAGDTDVREPPLRVVTAASLFDGHDAAINVIRRLIQAVGAEVIHLGHDRGAAEVVRAAIQEDADAIAVSSYQGGHMEYFTYMIDLLRDAGAGHIPVFGGGGGTITPAEIVELQAYGVERLYHPDEGLTLGLQGMVGDLVERAERRRIHSPMSFAGGTGELVVAQTLSALEDETIPGHELDRCRREWADSKQAPVVGITGTGGAGKSTVTDELLRRFLALDESLRLAIVAVDPSRRRTGGALLGDRMRFNSLASERAYFRSFATRRRHLATSAVLADAVAYLRSVHDLVVVETAGIGQSDSEIVDLVDVPVYVMTAEFGAPSQLEKIEMLDLASLVVLNKSDRRGSADALRAVRRQWKRNHLAFTAEDTDIPVIPAVASRFGDAGTTRVFAALVGELRSRGAQLPEPPASPVPAAEDAVSEGLVPAVRTGYLGEIAAHGRALRADVEARVSAAATAQHCYEALRALGDSSLPVELEPFPTGVEDVPALAALRARYGEALADLGAETADALRAWPALIASLTDETYAYEVRGRTIEGSNYRDTQSGLRVPKIAAPRLDGWGDRTRFLLEENVPGAFPYTAGVYPYRRENEDPTRMFAGEGTPEQTNARFHYLAAGQPAARLSTAFDSVTLYGSDPARRLDIYGKVGNSGVSVATVDDAKKLYSGFDLCSPSTSVSMTINGPAPIVLAFFFNAAIDQQVERHLRERGDWDRVARELDASDDRPRYGGELPPGHDGLGLGLLGVSGDRIVGPETYARIRADTLAVVRGTVQADILKEDQAQNTCIFSTEFALKLMGDVQESFAAQAVRNFYSVSISGYHIAEAGANPITQLAFTLANGFTIVEYYLARGMAIDDFAPNLSFFFSNGMDPEYTVLGRVARRIWARAMRDRYGASPRSQMLKYHIQTSGRSLHAQEIAFNDIRTTLQALTAIVDNCSSLHTNAYDEAVTTPTEESVRRALAIQLVINREFGLAACENPLQGSFLVGRLTDVVEEAVYAEFDRLSERGGVLGAMDAMYQRGKIQDESLLYETRKHDGSLPIVGVNTFLSPHDADDQLAQIPLQRSTAAEKDAQIASVEAFSRRHAQERPAALARLQRVARDGGNVFDELLETVKVASLGEITMALFEVGGEYRRSM